MKFTSGIRFYLIVIFCLFFYSSARAQDTITICKDVRLITFTIYTTQGKAIAWQWTLSGGNYSGSLTDSTCGPVAYPNTGVFTADCKVTFSGGSDTIHRFIIKVFDGTVGPIGLRDTTICGNIALTLDAGNGGNPIARFKWQPGGETTRQITATSPGTYTVSVYTVDDYSYNYPGFVSCDSAWVSATVKQGAKPSVNLGPDRFVCNDNPTTLDAGTDGSSYIWSPNGETTQTITVALPGTYSVTVTNNDGCSSTDDIFLRDSCPMFLFVPSAFTPDETNLNDIFIWKGNMIMKKYNMIIFSRWGEKLFETKDPAKGWDGYYEGKVCPQGVYVYLIDCVDTHEDKHSYRGNFTLLK